MSANGAFNLELILKTGNTRTEKGLYRKGPGRMPGPHTRKGPRLRRFLRCSPPGRHRHRTRVIRTAKFSTSGAMPCAASTTVASTHPAAVADHSGILTDRPISEGSKATDCMMELPGTLTRCSSGKSGARSNEVFDIRRDAVRCVYDGGEYPPRSGGRPLRHPDRQANFRRLEGD